MNGKGVTPCVKLRCPRGDWRATSPRDVDVHVDWSIPSLPKATTRQNPTYPMPSSITPQMVTSKTFSFTFTLLIIHALPCPIGSSSLEEKPEQNSTLFLKARIQIAIFFPILVFFTMRPSFVVSLLILSLLLAKAQGIRLGKVSLALQQQKQHDEESTLLKRSETDAEEKAVLCSKDQQCTGSIKNRKLVTASVSTTQSMLKNVMKGEHKTDPLVTGNTRNVNLNEEVEEVKVNTLTISKHKDVPQEHYPDLVDIAEMDYSPARRKPPIHN
ncbi:hypothetical protein VNO77_24192 [Canavalia gladiata]|uniref:Uncharacterized protein n=1 Tax=Canavalia gladiata TaxID=3824 RepID=A0AAN9LB51_CANGL